MVLITPHRPLAVLCPDTLLRPLPRDDNKRLCAGRQDGAAPGISPLRPSEQILTSPSTPSPSLSLLLYAQDGKTALHRAAENGHVETVLALLEGKATVDAHDKVMFVRRFGSHHKNPASQSVPSAVASYRQKDRSESRWLFPGLLKYRPGQEGDSASTFQVLIWSILMMIII